ncbi:MAG: radical SAM protein [Planctomycetota bacterium]|nr:MAG: radical SAM protein [Planctomycetota bacterium]
MRRRPAARSPCRSPGAICSRGPGTINSIEATRGCPHKCDFCVVPAAWSNTYAHRPVEDVIAELETFTGRKAIFIDLSPTEDVHYAKALYRAMIPLRFRWVGLSTTRIAEDEELLELAARSGCKGLLIGFESISQDTLNQTHKHFHAAPRYGEVIKKLHDHGIGIQGCFVFGFDNDEESVFERTVEFVDRTKIDLPRYAVATPFPNTGEAAAQELDPIRRRTRRPSAQADEPGAATGGTGMGMAAKLSPGLDRQAHHRRALVALAAVGVPESWLSILRPASAREDRSRSSRSRVPGRDSRPCLPGANGL